jgi:hypothetical protein
MAKMGELKRAAELLGVTSTTLRQHGCRTASPVRIQAMLDDPPDWLTIARERHDNRCAKRRMKSVHRSTADRLDVAVVVGRERGINLADVADLVAAPPEWLVIAEQRRRAHREREQADAQRRAAREAHELQVAEAYLRAVKDGGDTDAWAASVLHAAGIHRIDLGKGNIVPVLPSALKVVR